MSRPRAAARPAAFALLLALAACGRAGAPTTGDPPAASAGAAASAAPAGVVPAIASVAPDPAPSADQDAGRRYIPPPPRLALEPAGPERSKVPSAGEWAGAPIVGRLDAPTVTCPVERVREWVRVTCDMPNGGVTLLAGTRAETYLWANEQKAQAMFPLRKGDRRVLQFTPGIDFSRFGYGMQPPDEAEMIDSRFVVSELWLDGEAPQLTSQ